MLTVKFDIQFTNDADKLFVSQKQRNYSYAFWRLYKHYDLVSDVEFLSRLSADYKLYGYEISCLKIDVKTKISQTTTQKDKLSTEIVSIEKEINTLRSKQHRTKKETWKLFKLNNKLVYKNRNLPKDITFGSRALLKPISFLNNDKEKNAEIIKSKKAEYLNNRLLPVNLIGAAGTPNSNRYFNFDFENNSIVYKPRCGHKININYKVSSKYQKYLLQLQQIKDLNQQPVSVKLTAEYIALTFDETILNDMAFNKKAYFADIKNITDKEERTQLYIDRQTELKVRKLKNKVADRYCAIDLNPEYIGVVIVDKNGSTIETFAYDLTKLTVKSGKSSSDKLSKYKNNKRKFEIGVIYSNLFKKLDHYKCAYFVMEDLNFKAKNVDDNAVEFNRKTKNIWNLNFQQNLIKKHCNILGIQLVEVNPCYSSFIGNITYNIFDPIAAALEICRRGFDKYIKGNKLYPELTNTILDTVADRFNSVPDVQAIKGCKTWIELFKFIQKTGLRYRRTLTEAIPDSVFSSDSMKSGVVMHCYNTV